jgi:dihydrofolate reductase
MSKVRVAGFSVSIDGFGAGLNQSLENPLGQRGHELFQWFFPTKYFCDMVGKGGGETGTDNDYGTRSMSNFGAFILGRNMFGPVRGPWPNEEWKGWWGENPPYHAPTFILTHHARSPITLQGGTTFHFVTDGIESALRQAKAAAGGKDVKIGGGVEAVRQYLSINAIDEMHLAVSPVVLGRGENLLAGIDLDKLGFKVTEHTPTMRATHILLYRPSKAQFRQKLVEWTAAHPAE